MILSSAVFMIEKYKSPVGDGNYSTINGFPGRHFIIEKYKSPVGDGNNAAYNHQTRNTLIEKYKSPVGDGNFASSSLLISS